MKQNRTSLFSDSNPCATTTRPCAYTTWLIWLLSLGNIQFISTSFSSSSHSSTQPRSPTSASPFPHVAPIILRGSTAPLSSHSRPPLSLSRSSSLLISLSRTLSPSRLSLSRIYTFLLFSPLSLPLRSAEPPPRRSCFSLNHRPGSSTARRLDLLMATHTRAMACRAFPLLLCSATSPKHPEQTSVASSTSPPWALRGLAGTLTALRRQAREGPRPLRRAPQAILILRRRVRNFSVELRV